MSLIITRLFGFRWSLVKVFLVSKPHLKFFKKMKLFSEGDGLKKEVGRRKVSAHFLIFLMIQYLPKFQGRSLHTIIHLLKLIYHNNTVGKILILKIIL